jgi:hypothetical protein
MKSALLLSLVFCSTTLFAELPTQLLFKCPVPVEKKLFFASVLHITTQKLYLLSSMYHSSEDNDDAKTEHIFRVPVDCTGDCLVFVNKDYKDIGGEFYKIKIKKNETNVLNVLGCGSIITTSFYNDIGASIKKGERLIACVYRISSDGVDPFFFNAIELTPLMSESSYMFIYGVTSGDYLYSIYNLDSNLPVCTRRFRIASSNVVNGLLWFSDAQESELRNGISLELKEGDKWFGFTGVVPLNRRDWWSERIAVDENGKTKLIDRRVMEMNR